MIKKIPVCKDDCCSGTTGTKKLPMHDDGDGCSCTASETSASAAITLPAGWGNPISGTFVLGGLDCGDCAAKLEEKLSSLPGVRRAVVNFGTGTLTAEYALPEADFIRAVEKAGYRAIPEKNLLGQGEDKAFWWNNFRTIATAVSGFFLLLATILEWSGIFPQALVPMFALSAAVGAYHSARVALLGLRSLIFDMNVLMSIAVVSAAAIGQWGEAAAVAFLFSLGNTLQSFTMDKTRQSIRRLLAMAPPEALVRRSGREERMAVERIGVGDTIIVGPGERIAMDGAVTHGRSAVNQAPITGESVPIEKQSGDTVFAGTVNEHGVLEIEVTRVAAHSTLAKIIHLVEEAQNRKAPSQQFTDVFARYYTPTVLLAAAGVMVIPWLAFAEPFAPWFYQGLVLLVISCPCALVISTPVSIVSAIGNASKQGVLIKGGAYLEELGGIRAVAFDKTGTLTHGRPAVTDIVPLADMSETEVLALAAAVEQRSQHPLARAINAKAKDLRLAAVTHARALVGLGIRAEVEGRTVFIGNRRLFEELGRNLAGHEAQLASLENQGKTAVLVGSEETLYGIIAVADTLRTNSPAALRALRAAGIRHIAMLTGDNRLVAEAIAARLELDGFRSDLLPDGKVAAIQDITREFGPVLMVGDGINDAPALAAAKVSVAMGVAGSDTAIETADIALMADDLDKLSYVIRLSRKTVAVIKENIVFSIVIKVVFVIAAFSGLANLWLAVFADMGASLLVTLNGMRLMRRLE